MSTVNLETKITLLEAQIKECGRAEIRINEMIAKLQEEIIENKSKKLHLEIDLQTAKQKMQAII